MSSLRRVETAFPDCKPALKILARNPFHGCETVHIAEALRSNPFARLRFEGRCSRRIENVAAVYWTAGRGRDCRYLPNPISFPIFLEAIQLMLQREEWILNVSPCPVGATTSACGHGNRSGERGVRKMPGKTHAPLQMKLPFDHLIGDGDERPTEINPPLFDRDGKTADQPCDHLQVPAVLVFEQSGEPLNTFIVAAQKRFAIDLSFSL
jgi:hypothetical protein